MSKAIVSKKKTQDIEIHNYERKIIAAYRLIEKELSQSNAKLITKYDKYMTRQSLAKTTRKNTLK